MTTDKFTLTIGVVPGYVKDRAAPMGQALEKIAWEWQIAAEAEAGENGPYVSAVAHPAKVLYSTAHKCPVGGETVVVLAGVRNPEFHKSPFTWRAAVEKIAYEVMAKCGQKTGYLEFTQVDLIYLKGE